GVASPDFFYNRGNARMALGLDAQAVDDFDKALAIVPDFAAAHRSRGHALTNVKRLEDAAESYSRAAAIDPMLPYALGYAVQARAQLCDWTTTMQTSLAWWPQ